MIDSPSFSPALRWGDAVAAIGLIRSARLSLIVRARAGPVRDALLALLGQDMVRITADADPLALEAGVDVMASLTSGVSVRTLSLAERLGDRVLTVVGAERLPDVLSALLVRTLDAGVPMVLIDEGDETGTPGMLADRVAMRVDLDGLSIRDIAPAAPVASGEPIGDMLPALCEAAAALGIGSLRAPAQALAVARALGRSADRAPCEDDLARAARLVLAPRARYLPQSEDNAPTQPEQDGDAPDNHDGNRDGGADRDMVLDAVRAAIPDDWLVARPARAGAGAGQAGSAATTRGSGVRGRAGRLRKGLPRRGARLDLTATLIAAAPMQRLRGRAPGDRIAFRSDDIRVRRPRPTQRSATIFAVDASGSAALSRLGEVKGAIEQLLAQSYVRRDEVALVAFRGTEAETLLPPTRSLARAKRELAALPGGGPTPLAAGIMAGLDHAIRSRMSGRSPLLLLLTDGGANIARDGTPGREQAREDAEAAAALVAGAGIAALVVDSSPRGEPRVRRLAERMGARYAALPRPDDAALARLVEDAR